MKQITLLPEDIDFEKVYKSNNSFTTGFIAQYVNSFDCPLAKALKRKLNIDYINVSGSSISNEDKIIFIGESIGLQQIANVCERVLKNGKGVLRFGCDVEF